jgi:hypothetical protein
MVIFHSYVSLPEGISFIIFLFSSQKWEIQSHLSSSFPVFGLILWGLYQLYLHFRCRRARCTEVIEAIGFGVPQALAAGTPVGDGFP